MRESARARVRECHNNNSSYISFLLCLDLVVAFTLLCFGFAAVAGGQTVQSLPAAAVGELSLALVVCLLLLLLLVLVLVLELLLLLLLLPLEKKNGKEKMCWQLHKN